MPKVRNRTVALAFVLIALFTGLRLVHLPADPPWDLDVSAGIFTDECHNIHCVRNNILFGSWQMDKYNSFIYSPIWTILQYPILKLLGVGLWQLKVLGIVLSFFTMVLIYKSFKEYFGYAHGVLAVSLFGLNYILVMFNRLGLYENLIVFFMVVTLFFWQRAIRTERSAYFFLSGFSSFMVFVGKSMTAYFLIAFLMTLIFWTLFEKEKRGMKLRWMALCVLGLLFVAAVWYLLFYNPNRAPIRALSSRWLEWIPPHPVRKVLLNTNPIFHRLRFMPVTLFVCWLYFVWLVNRRPFRLDPVELLILLWALGAGSFPNMLEYNPLRYYLPVVPPLIFLSVIFLMPLLSSPPTLILPRPKPSACVPGGGMAGDASDTRAGEVSPQEKTSLWQFLVLNFLYFSATFFYFVIPYTRFYLRRVTEAASIRDITTAQSLTLSLFIGAILAPVLTHIVALRKRSTDVTFLKWRKFLAVGLIACIIIVNMSFYLRWALNPGYVLRDSSREVGKMLAPDAFVVGQGVMNLLLETKLRYVEYPNWYEDGKRIFLDYPITHIYAPDYAGHLKWFQKHYPIVMKYSKVLKVYRIWGKKFYLFEMNIPPEEREAAFKFRS